MNRSLKKGAAFLAAAAAGGIVRSQFERDHFTVEEETLYSPKLKKERTLIFLSDLHDKEFGEGNVRLLWALRCARPDAILIGGDTMVVKPEAASLEVTGRLLKGLAGLGVPVFYGNGNHEQRLREEGEIYGNLYLNFRHLLKDFGVIYLSNRSAPFGEDIVVSGVDIEKKYYRNMVPARMRPSYLTNRLGEADASRYQILLMHSPLFFDACVGWGADLTLAGHFHGGTIRLPGLGGLMTPQLQFFLPYCAGSFERNGCCMIVSRGLGTHSINIRFNNRPQVIVLKLVPGNAPVREPQLQGELPGGLHPIAPFWPRMRVCGNAGMEVR